jgi:hypothetical protein
MLGTILLIVLILILLGALPTWPYSGGWGYYPSSGFGTLTSDQGFSRSYDISYRGLKLPRVSAGLGRHEADLPQVGLSGSEWLCWNAANQNRNGYRERVIARCSQRGCSIRAGFRVSPVTSAFGGSRPGAPR